MKVCKQCGRPRHSGLCDMALLSNGRTVHVSRIDDINGDVRKAIERGEVKVVNRFIKKQSEPKRKARRS